MSKKHNLKENEKFSESEESLEVTGQETSNVVSPAKEENSKPEKVKEAKQSKVEKKKKDKKPKEKKVARKAREMSSELKKVTWPGFAEVCKKTGIVLVVVILFAIVLFGLDTLFGYLFGLLT